MSYHWSIHQLTEYFVAVSNPAHPHGAVSVALERATEALEAELGAVTLAGEVEGAIGFGGLSTPGAFLAEPDGGVVQVPGIGEVHLAVGSLDTPDGRSGLVGARLIVGRLDEGYSAEERQMLQGMALVLGLRLQSLATLAAEQQRHRLVEHLLQIQRAVSARRPLDEVLDAVTAGASSLLGDAPVGLLLTDVHDANQLRLVSTHRLPHLEEALADVARQLLTPDRGGTLPESSPTGVQSRVLGERVVVAGEVVGCLVARTTGSQVGGHDPAELLSAFAQQVNLALTDARTLDEVHQAHRDPVTALPNRALFLQRLEDQRAAASQAGSPLAVLFIDLDRFKAVNDTLGHRAGDQLLAEVAQRILTCVSDEDVAARLGGDEFAVLLRGVGSSIGGNVAERIITALTKTFTIEGRDVLIGASVGVAELADHQDASTLLSDADVAMYCAKRSGRGRWILFEPRMHHEVADQLSLRTDLQHAEAAGQLWVAYQPIVALATGQVEGVEALIRWDHPARGQIPPSDFIPLAEESDTIAGLGAFVIREAFADLARWRKQVPNLHLAVNVSGRQLVDGHLPGLVAEALDRAGLPGEAVTLEVTESVLMADPERARDRLASLKALGVRLALDDFGTGYSSLSYLRQFPVDQVKIDRSFVQGLHPNAHSEIALLRGILYLCHALDLQVVAEGIENAEALAVLAELGCALGQGYHFARPQPAQAQPHVVHHLLSMR
jgi:diguanylate cyclase (GGDEF)-like protein